MDTGLSFRRGRGRGHEANGRGRPHSKNKTWVAGSLRNGNSSSNHVENDRWERGGHHGGRGKRANRLQKSATPNAVRSLSKAPDPGNVMDDEEEEYHEEEYEEEAEEDELPEEYVEPALETPEAREKFYQELVKAREQERKQAIADGKMDDPLIPKRLEDAITMVGTCMDMAPRFERYRRERENNLFEWETISGTKRVDHRRAVKMYERAAGDKTLPSDLRPPAVLKKTLDYLFHDLLPRGGFSQTFNFIRDRSRAVRNDFTMQHETGPIAIECHDRCARFHIIALHFERERPGFSIALEEQQLMNTLQSLKEFYEDQRGRYESPTELEMRVYHRLIHIRDQRERHEDVPAHIVQNPVFKLTTRFRQHVQARSAPISKTSKLVVDAQGMEIFGELAVVLREQGSVVMIYLVACILERLFGPDTIDDIESIRGDLSIPDIIDGIATEPDSDDHLDENSINDFPLDRTASNNSSPPPKPAVTEWPTKSSSSKSVMSAFSQDPSSLSTPSAPLRPFGATSAPPQPVQSAFSNLSSTPNAFTTTSSIFGASSAFKSALPKPALTHNSFASTSPFSFDAQPNVFAPSLAGQSIFGGSTFPPKPRIHVDDSSMADTTSVSSVPPLTPSVNPSVRSEGVSLPSTEVPASAFQNANHFVNLPRSPLPFANSSSNSTPPTFAPPINSILPLRYDNINQPFQVKNDIPPSSTRLNRASLASPQSLSNFNIPTVSPPVPESDIYKFAPPAGKDAQASSGKPLAFPNFPSSTNTLPLRPRIDTTASEPSVVSDLPRSPLPQPPSLNKHQTISLPSTPTATAATVSFPSSIAPKRPKSILDSLKGTLEIGVPASNEVLSPLVLSSASTSRAVQNLTNGIPTSASPSKLPLDKLANPLNGRAVKSNKANESDLESQAINFLRTGTLVKKYFGRWRQHLADKVAWSEACRRGDAYSQNIQRQRELDSSTSEKKRRATLSTLSDTPVKKRARKRVSGEYKKPHIDEELARRFKANHEEHERRWAQGSFLSLIQEYIKRKSGAYLQGWQIWLSMNPEMDGTAIWLERKFDVPASGQWISDIIFSIPFASSRFSQVSPGLIVFERTPLEGITDDIERKYRVLDDCSRLRDIIEVLPPKRHFVPSLLTVSWVDSKYDDTAVDFNTMISKLIEDGIIGGHHNFAITIETKDLDAKLEEALDIIGVDVEGRLVQLLSVRAIFKSFESTWVDFSSEWIASCSINGKFDWFLYGKMVEALVYLLNSMATLSLGLLGISQMATLPLFRPGDILDSNTIYDIIMSWLEKPEIRDVTGTMSMDLASRRSMEGDFPSETFVNQLHDLVIRLVERRVGDNSKHCSYVLKAELTSATRQVEVVASSQTDSLRKAFNSRARRSPKRRSFDFEDSETSRFSTPTKRRKISISNTSTLSDGASQTSSPPNLSPSPTASMSTTATDGESPAITVAMLRALSRDVKAKYGNTPLAQG